MATDEPRHLLHKRHNKTILSIKQSNKISVIGRQNRGRDVVITKKRLKVNSLLAAHDPLKLWSENEENEQILNAIKNLKKGDKLKTLTCLHRLFARRQSNADQFLKQDGLQSLHACFKSLNVDVLHTAAWCIVNLTAAASSSYSNVLLGLAPTLMQFLKGSDTVMQELCSWGLANLAGDSQCNVDVLHKQGCTDALLDLLEIDYLSNEEQTKSILFALINLTRGNVACVKCVHDRDVHQMTQVLLKGTPVQSSLNFEIGWILASIYPGGDDLRLHADHFPIITRLVSNRLNSFAEESELLHRDKVYFPFVRCLFNLVGQDASMARVVLDDLRTFKTIPDLLASGSHGLKQEILGLVNNCMGIEMSPSNLSTVDVCSRVLLTLQPSILSGILSQCQKADTDLAIQAVQVIQAMARSSSRVDWYLLHQGVLPHLTQALISSCSHRAGSERSEELLDRQAVLAKIVTGILVDLATSLPDMVKTKLEEEDSKRSSTTLTFLTSLMSSDQVDSDLQQMAGQFLRLLGLT